MIPGAASPDQSRAPSQAALSNPAVARNDSTVNAAPQSAAAAPARSSPSAAPAAPIQCRRNRSAEIPATIHAASHSSGSPRMRRMPPRVSSAKTPRLRAKSRKAAISASPAKPVESAPSPGAMPEVASVDIARHAASNGGTPVAARTIQRTPVSAA